ncbi:MAG: rhomboid family intramembrane serine protease [Alphaproteobacteria bacterium]|nr:rhomboid family intramembrane serine protease [Alphaproteobacteria bacterium]
MTQSAPSPARSWLPFSIAVLLGLCVGPEMLLQLTDHGLLGPQTLRAVVFRYGAFQSDLVSGGKVLFAGQSFTMFGTYMFLHTGLQHLAVNMIGLVWLWRLILDRRTPTDAALLYLMSGVGAALVFALCGPQHTAMVGASGALFGLLGVYGVDSRLFWSDAGRTGLIQKVVRLVAIAAILVLSDLVSRVAIGTSVAWQAHTGGFLTGAFAALIWPRH